MIYGSDDIFECLKEVCPVSVAVAYIGKGWSRFIKPNNLRTVVVSPNLGSNPSAIVELAEKLGWENVLLLEGLHSKIYIGANAVMVGSANLSSNAFGTTKQEEACVVLRGQESIKKAQEMFNTYVLKAKTQFPDQQSKIARVERLRQEWRKAISQGLIQNERDEIQSFDSYRPGRDGKVYFAWYINEDTGYTDEVPIAIQNDIKAEVHLSPDDIKPKCQWILQWLLSPKNGAVDGRSRPMWVYVHEVFENGCDDEGYEVLCIQRSSLDLPTKPFNEKEDRFINSFRSVMNRAEFAGLRGESNAIWRLKDKLRLTERFVSELQNDYIQSKKRSRI